MLINWFTIPAQAKQSQGEYTLGNDKGRQKYDKFHRTHRGESQGTLFGSLFQTCKLIPGVIKIELIFCKSAEVKNKQYIEIQGKLKRKHLSLKLGDSQTTARQ